jgi:hypothetical protein
MKKIIFNIRDNVLLSIIPVLVIGALGYNDSYSMPVFLSCFSILIFENWVDGRYNN